MANLFRHDAKHIYLFVRERVKCGKNKKYAVTNLHSERLVIVFRR